MGGGQRQSFLQRRDGVGLQMKHGLGPLGLARIAIAAPLVHTLGGHEETFEQFRVLHGLWEQHREHRVVDVRGDLETELLVSENVDICSWNVSQWIVDRARVRDNKTTPTYIRRCSPWSESRPLEDTRRIHRVDKSPG